MYRGLILLPFCLFGLMAEITFFVLLILPVAVVSFVVGTAVMVSELSNSDCSTESGGEED